MEDFLSFLKNLVYLFDYKKIYIKLAAPEKILSWSYGEVKTSETINYRTFKAEHDGLFCAKIFGPMKDYECLCSRYKFFQHQGLVCEKCGVEVTESKVRRERMGHIKLASPVAHIWYLKSLPSRIGLLLDMSLRDIERILYFETYVVTDAGETSLKYKQLLSESHYLDALEEYGHEFKAKMGGEAIDDLLCAIDLAAEAKSLREQIKMTQSESHLKKLQKRLKLILSILHSGNRPEWMILKVLPVLPPDLRPLVSIDYGRFASSDLNELYRRIINRNNRIKRLVELHAPDMMIRNEKRMLQEAVDALLDNSRRERPFVGVNKLPLQSLSDMIKGKQGRFRQNLLGKRVDYSGRSVIVVGPSLKLHQCGLPKEMALELFKPFVFHHLQKYGFISSIKMAKQWIETQPVELWDVLEEVIRQHPILLNRAPTLYRLGLQAFEPVLVEGKAIQLHPLVCQAFNASFDGDQMAVHVPLSIEAQLEARVLMMATNNILSPTNGEPLIDPSQEMVLGLYFMTQKRSGARGEKMVFADINEVHRAYESEVVDLQALVMVRFNLPTDSQSKVKHQRIKTTTGRILLFQHLFPLIPFEFLNRCLNKQSILELIHFCYSRFGLEKTIHLAEKLMNIGFRYATKAGVSLSIDDLIIPLQKSTLINDTLTQLNTIQKQYTNGIITHNQKYHKTIDIWTEANEKLAHMVLTELSGPKPKTKKGSSAKNKLKTAFIRQNALHMVIDAGIQNLIQIHQLVGMRGLMTKTDNSIIESPVTANFREGLDVRQYFISTHGTRKGLADTALKTANAGYLTRRLIDVAQEVIIADTDCGTKQGFTLTALIKEGQVIESLWERVLGRVTAEDIFVSHRKKPIMMKGTLLREQQIRTLKSFNITQIKIRSPITCELRHGICAQCYGQDLGRGQLVAFGEAIGIVAAQSIGESGTQLTMRTHQSGGIAKRTATTNYIEVNFQGCVKFRHIKLIKQQEKDNHQQQSLKFNTHSIVVSRGGELSIINELGQEQAYYKVPYGAILSVKEGDAVAIGQQIAHWDTHTLPIITEVAGQVQFTDIFEGLTVHREVDELTGLNSVVVTDPKLRPTQAKKMRPAVKLVNEHLNGQNSESPVTYVLPPHAIIDVDEGTTVNRGDIIARLPQNSPKTSDITQGLPRVVDLFEARVPKEPAILAPHSGQIRLGKGTKTKHRLIITNDQGQQEEFSIPKWRHINVFEDQWVQQGEVLVDGDLNLHDILRLKGPHELVIYLLNEMQEIYRLQGVKINDKHFEVIFRQMLRSVTIVEPGDSFFLQGEIVTYSRLLAENERITASAELTQLPRWESVLLGITKASLATDSFISAASFMDTTRVLLNSTINGQCDELRGLKENVIMGRLIPAGTGLNEFNNK